MVTITARITSDGRTVIRNVTVNIDHDSPYLPYFDYPLSATVGTEVPFNISITDYWGNRIDNRRGPHTISLHVHGPVPDDCSFVGYGHDIPGLTLDANGNQSVNVKLTTKVGPNNILMDSFGSIPDKLRWINADTNGIPFSIAQEYIPTGTPPALPADSSSKFTIIYSLLDRYGNPAGRAMGLGKYFHNGRGKQVPVKQQWTDYHHVWPKSIHWCHYYYCNSTHEQHNPHQQDSGIYQYSSHQYGD